MFHWQHQHARPAPRGRHITPPRARVQPLGSGAAHCGASWAGPARGTGQGAPPPCGHTGDRDAHEGGAQHPHGSWRAPERGLSVRGADCCQDERGRGDPLNKGKDRAELTPQETNHTSTWRPAHRLHGDHRGADPCQTEEAASLIPSPAKARRNRTREGQDGHVLDLGPQVLGQKRKKGSGHPSQEWGIQTACGGKL